MGKNGWIAVSGIVGATAVGLGAFGAHGLEDTLSKRYLAAFNTGADYQLLHAVALLGVAGLASERIAQVAGLLFLLGVLLFSGSLYLLAFVDLAWFGLLTPLGGVCFIAGWLTLAIGGVSTRFTS